MSDGNYTAKRVNGKRRRIHRLLAEDALGRPLRGAECIHHADGNRHNNEPSNLVICPDNAYHKLLHLRLDAYMACGNPAHRKCRYCKQYDDVHRLAYQPKWTSAYYHTSCNSKYQRSRRQK